MLFMRATLLAMRELLFVSVAPRRGHVRFSGVTETVLGEAGMPHAKDRDELQSDNPVCPACAHPMALLRIEPGKPDHQMRTYKCLDCREPFDYFKCH